MGRGSGGGWQDCAGLNGQSQQAALRSIYALLTYPSRVTLSLQLVFMVSEGQRLKIPAREQVAGATPEPTLYAAYVALIERCWSQRPADRPDFEEVIKDLRSMQSNRTSGSVGSPTQAPLLLRSSPGTPAGAANRGKPHMVAVVESGAESP